MKLEDFKKLHIKFSNPSLSYKELKSEEFENYRDVMYDNQEFKNWSLQYDLEKLKFDYNKYCCLVMANHISESLNDIGEIKYDDHDVIMNQWKDGTFGIPIHDGGASVIKINFCPWCGNNLRK